MRIRTLLLAATLASGALLVGPASAAPPVQLVIPDPANDANALNGQQVGGGPLDGNATPVGSQPEKDFTKITLAPMTVKKGKKISCTGFTATVTLSAPAATDGLTIYRITGVTPTNKRAFWLVFDGTSTDMAHGTDPGTTGSSTYTPLKRPAKLVGNTLTFTVLESDLKAADETVAGFRWTGLGAHSRSSLVVATVPMWDKVVVPATTAFSLC